jgi:hypothetical protein
MTEVPFVSVPFSFRRFTEKDHDLREIHHQWEHALRKAVLELPEIGFDGDGKV